MVPEQVAAGRGSLHSMQVQGMPHVPTFTTSAAAAAATGTASGFSCPAPKPFASTSTTSTWKLLKQFRVRFQRRTMPLMVPK